MSGRELSFFCQGPVTKEETRRLPRIYGSSSSSFLSITRGVIFWESKGRRVSVETRYESCDPVRWVGSGLLSSCSCDKDESWSHGRDDDDGDDDIRRSPHVTRVGRVTVETSRCGIGSLKLGCGVNFTLWKTLLLSDCL